MPCSWCRRSAALSCVQPNHARIADSIVARALLLIHPNAFLDFLEKNRLAVRANPRAFILNHLRGWKCLATFHAGGIALGCDVGWTIRVCESAPIRPAFSPNQRLGGDRSGLIQRGQFGVGKRAAPFVVLGVIPIHRLRAADLTTTRARWPAAILRARRASHQSALRVGTRFHKRARLDETTSILHSPRARRPRSRPRPTVCACRNKSCRKPSRAARAIAMELAKDHHDLIRPASRSRLDRHSQPENETLLLPMELPAIARLDRELAALRRSFAANRRAVALFRRCRSRSRVARNFPWRIDARSRELRRPPRGRERACRGDRPKILPGLRARIRARPC